MSAPKHVDNADLSFRVVIPARFASTRLPGKPLRLIAGKPLIQHVYMRARESGAQEVIIATDDERIAAAAEEFGASVCMTAPDHQSGTDRIAEVAARYAWPDEAVIVNLQGDEPLMPALLLRQVASSLQTHADAGIATLCMQIHDRHTLFTPDVVKVVTDARGYALYFSRSVIPYHRTAFASVRSTPLDLPLPETGAFHHHLGLYAYRADILRAYPRLEACGLERVEALEQLRALWHGIRIYVEEAREIPLYGGVDTEHDLIRVSELLTDSPL